MDSTEYQLTFSGVKGLMLSRVYMILDDHLTYVNIVRYLLLLSLSIIVAFAIIFFARWLVKKTCFYLKIRLFARDFYEVIVGSAFGLINYHLIEIESE